MHRIYERHSLNLCIPYRFKSKICFGCPFIYYMQVLSVPSLCNEGIVNIQMLCSIPSVSITIPSGIVIDTDNAFILKLKEHSSLA